MTKRRFRQHILATVAYSRVTKSFPIHYYTPIKTIKNGKETSEAIHVLQCKKILKVSSQARKKLSKRSSEVE